MRARYRADFGELAGGGYLNPPTRAFLAAYHARFGDLPPEAETSGFVAYVHKEELAPDLLRQLWDDRPRP